MKKSRLLSFIASCSLLFSVASCTMPDSDIINSVTNGVDGQDGKDGTDGVDGKDGTDGVDGKDGEDGATPYIGDNGNWWIDGQDTGVEAGKGADGQDGKDGADGQDGADGKSAYEIFIENNPEYTGDEKQWISDLCDGKFFELSKYSVQFMVDGEVYSSVDVLSSQAVEKPENPKKAGWIFTGWYTDDGEKWNFSANVVLADTTLTAHWVKSDEKPTCYFQNVYSDAYSVHFSIYHDELTTPTSITVYSNGVKVDSTDNASADHFDGLQSGTDYWLEVTYTYDLNDGFGAQTGTAQYYFMTTTLMIPYVSFNSISSTKDSISFDYSVMDYSNIGSISKINVYKEGVFVEELTDTAQKEITGLESNTTYTIEIIYSYDLNDGNGAQEIKYTNTVTTASYTAPTISFADKNTTQNSLSGTIKTTDPDDIDTITAIALYKGDELVEEYDAEEVDILAEELEENTEYTLKVTYSYDLHDGQGEQTKTAEFKCRTHPVYKLTDTKIENDSVVLEGDMIYIAAVVDNPSGARFTKAVVNGKEYEVNSSSTSTEVYINFQADDVGVKEYTISKLYAELDGSEYIFYTDENNTASLKVYNRLDVDSIEIVNSEFESKDYFFNNESVYVKINLDNPEGYQLKGVTLNGQTYSVSSLIENEDFSAYYVDVTSYVNSGFFSFYLTSATYGNDSINKTVNYNYDYYSSTSDNKETQKCLRFSDSTIHTISTASQLNSITTNSDMSYASYCYYQLSNDIDLSTVSWNRPSMFGILDGNGYKIKGYQFVDNVENQYVNLSIFDCFIGFVKNLTISESKIHVTMSENNTSNYSAYIAFINLWGSAYFDHVYVDDTCSISFDNLSTTYNVMCHIGSLSNSSCTLSNCGNSANISVHSESGFDYSSKLICGLTTSSNSTIDYCYNTGNITSTYSSTNNYTSGFLYSLMPTSTYSTYVTNSYNTGLINNNGYDTALGINGCDFSKTHPNEILEWKPVTYTFETNGGDTIDSITAPCLTNFPIPAKNGSRFYNWFDNEQCTGEGVADETYLAYALPSMFPASTFYYSQEDTTFYAKWLDAVDDYSSLATNNSSNPFYVDEDGYLCVSFDSSNYYSSSDYTITADKKMRIYYSYSTSGSGYVNFYKNGEYCMNIFNYVDLDAGDTFRIYASQDGNSDYSVKFNKFDVCYLD